MCQRWWCEWEEVRRSAYHDGLRLERGGDLLGSLGAVESDGDARRTLGHGDRAGILRRDQGDGVGDGVRGESVDGGDDADADLLQAADGADRLLVVGAGNLAEEDGIRRGDVAKRHTHGELGAEIAVEGILAGPRTESSRVPRALVVFARRERRLGSLR